MQAEEAFQHLARGAAQIVTAEALREKLGLGRPLRVKLGVDPTSPDIHLGHSVVLRKLRQFQELGHTAVLIIGDFTALVGDPSGRSATRPTLGPEEIRHNAATYHEQALKILDPDRTEVVFNSAWLGKLSYEDVIRLNSRVTLQQMLQREDFRARLDREDPIHAHEIQYPIMQAWDSVMVKADVELGGTDQLFNILVGRDFQKMEGQPQQVVFVLPILEGLDGQKKMSKSLGNYIGISEAPGEMAGKIMSISDELMARYYNLLLDRALPSGTHPMEAKKTLARELITMFHSASAAEEAVEEWTLRFSERRLEAADLPKLAAVSAPEDAVNLVVRAFEACGVNKSRSDVRRLIEQGSVQLDGVRLSDPKAQLQLQPGQILRLDKTHSVRVE